jgi:AP-3 complex subunit beta
MAIKTCIRDMSPYVRKAAAFSIAKVYRLDSSQHDSLIEIIQVLLEDTSTIVIGGAISALFVILSS